MDDWTNKGSGPLIAPDRLKGLSVRSDTRGLLHLFSQVAALALTTTLLALAGRIIRKPMISPTHKLRARERKAVRCDISCWPA